MKKRILFLITTLHDGGAEKALIDIVNMLPPNKYDVTVQTILDGGKQLERLNKNIRYKKILHSSNRIISKLFSLMIKYFPQIIYKVYIKDGYDIEVAFLEGKPTRLLSYSSEIKSVKVAWIHTDLEMYYDSGKDYLSYLENKNAYTKYDKIVCVSEGVKQAYLTKFDNRVENVKVLYNVVESDVIKKMSCDTIGGEWEKTTTIVMACGRLCEQKGFKRLIEIHKMLILDGILHNLWIVGDGPEKANLEELIKMHRLEDTVKLWGFQSNPYKFMRKTDLFVCSSIAEGYSTVVTEALILGVPILSVDVAGAKEPLECPRCNVIVDNTDKNLYEGLKNILTNPHTLERYREDQRRKAPYFEGERFVKDIVNFLET